MSPKVAPVVKSHGNSPHVGLIVALGVATALGLGAIVGSLTMLAWSSAKPQPVVASDGLRCSAPPRETSHRHSGISISGWARDLKDTDGKTAIEAAQAMRTFAPAAAYPYLVDASETTNPDAYGWLLCQDAEKLLDSTSDHDAAVLIGHAPRLRPAVTDWLKSPKHRDTALFLAAINAACWPDVIPTLEADRASWEKASGAVRGYRLGVLILERTGQRPTTTLEQDIADSGGGSSAVYRRLVGR